MGCGVFGVGRLHEGKGKKNKLDEKKEGRMEGGRVWLPFQKWLVLRGKVRDMRGRGQKTERGFSGVYVSVCLGEWLEKKEKKSGKEMG